MNHQSSCRESDQKPARRPSAKKTLKLSLSTVRFHHRQSKASSGNTESAESHRLASTKHIKTPLPCLATTTDREQLQEALQAVRKFSDTRRPQVSGYFSSARSVKPEAAETPVSVTMLKKAEVDLKHLYALNHFYECRLSQLQTEQSTLSKEPEQFNSVNQHFDESGTFLNELSQSALLAAAKHYYQSATQLEAVLTAERQHSAELLRIIQAVESLGIPVREIYNNKRQRHPESQPALESTSKASRE